MGLTLGLYSNSNTEQKQLYGKMGMPFGIYSYLTDAVQKTKMGMPFWPIILK